MRIFYKNIILAVVFLMVAASLFSLLMQPGKPPSALSINQLVEKLNAGEVAKITVQGDRLLVELKNGERALARKEAEASFTETLKNYGVQPEALQGFSLELEDESGFQFWAGVLIQTLLPLLFVVVLFWFIFRQAKTGASQAFNFGRANLRPFTQFKDKITFKDVAGLQEAKQELEEVVDFLKNPKKFLDLGARIPRGVLLMGSPGTGKTLLARATAGESGVPFFHISASEFVEMFVGVGASVTGDTPVLIRENGHTRLVPISEFIDQYYAGDEEGIIKPVSGVQTLGYRSVRNGFWGTRSKNKSFFGGSVWSDVRAVYRHRAPEIYNIRYRGGIIRTTSDHSIFVRSRNMITAKRASELVAGDVLVNLPFKVRGAFVPAVGTTHIVRAHDFSGTERAQELDLYGRELQAQAAHYEFALVGRGVMAQAKIGALIGVSQSGVKDWQIGNRLPRIMRANVYRAGTPPRLAVTPDLLRLLGYYTAEGNIDRYATHFTFGIHETALHDDCRRLIRDIFRLEPSLRPRPETNSLRITVSSPYISRFFEAQCGTGSHAKHVPAALWDMPKDYFLAYLEGYARGDGYTTKDGKLSATSVSKQLIRELAWLAAMHGIQAGVRETMAPAGRRIGTSNKALPATKSWNLIIGKTAHPFAPPSDIPDQFKRPIVESIEVEHYTGFVYDLCGCENEAFFGGEKPVLLHNSRTRDAFATAKKAAPSILFIDEIDAVGRERGAGLGGGHDEREQTLNQILVEMDGFERDTKVIVLAATNRPDILDPALLRPGRFDRRVVLDLPDLKDREDILKIHARGKPLEKVVDLKGVAVRTPGFSGADLANLMNEAAILTARQNRKVITQDDLYSSIEKVLLGPERRGKVISEKEKKITAYHEAGHALVAANLKDADPIHKISIVSRGQVGGYTLKLPTEEVRLRTRAQFLADLAVMMGGYAAEQIVFHDISTGASDDIKQASNLARKLVTRFGMSNLGPVTFGKSQEMVFLGREIAVEKDYSETVAYQIDQEVKRFIDAAHETAKKAIQSQKKILEKIAETLLKKETLEKEEFYGLLKTFKLKPVVVISI